MSRYLGVITKNGEQFLNTTFYYGTNPTMECNARGVLAMVDSWVTCFSFRLPFWLDAIGLGYISAGLNSAVIFMSLVGEFKDSYKLYILSQAFWNLFISYDFICNKPTHRHFVNADPKVASALWNQGPPTCFYWNTEVSPSWAYFFKQMILRTLQYMPFFQVFNLSFSRFLALYKPTLYSHLNKVKIAAIYIIVFNILSIMVINAETIYGQARSLITLSSCTYANGTVNNLCFLKAFEDSTASFITLGTPPIVSIILLALTTIMIIAVFAKVFWQLKYAYDHKQKNVGSTGRLAVMMLLQFIVAFLIFLFISFGEFLQIWIYSLFIRISGLESTEYLTEFTPAWVKLLNDSQASLNVLRAVIDSINVFIILSVYRKGILTAVRFVLHPKQSMYSIKNRDPTITMTMVQPFQNTPNSHRCFGFLRSFSSSTTSH